MWPYNHLGAFWKPIWRYSGLLTRFSDHTPWKMIFSNHMPERREFSTGFLDVTSPMSWGSRRTNLVIGGTLHPGVCLVYSGESQCFRDNLALGLVVTPLTQLFYIYIICLIPSSYRCPIRCRNRIFYRQSWIVPEDILNTELDCSWFENKCNLRGGRGCKPVSSSKPLRGQWKSELATESPCQPDAFSRWN